MERVDIKVGFYCNNQCKFCVQGRKRDSLPAKDKKEVESSLLDAYAKGKREVVFTGGEPCLHPDFFELIKIAKCIGFPSIQIQSNGRMFAYPGFCMQTISAGATQFALSLHGHTAAIHDDLTEAIGSFDQTVNGIKNLKKLGQYVLCNSVITTDNYKHLPKLARLLVDLGADQFQFAFIHILGTADKNRNWIVPKKSAIMPYVKKAIAIGVKAGCMVTTEAIPFCFMKGYEQFVAEQMIPETSIYDAGYIIDDYGKERRDNSKAKAPSCRQCKYFNLCEGPWKEYADLYGWDEFKAVV